MEHESAYDLACNIKLRSGITISQRSLVQKMTYAGVLEGCPVKFINDRCIQESVKYVKKARPYITNYILVEPFRRAYLSVPGDMDDFNLPGSGRIAEFLPAIDAHGEFFTILEQRHISFLVHWFQDCFSDSPPDYVIDHLSEIDFKSLEYFTADDY